MAQEDTNDERSRLNLILGILALIVLTVILAVVAFLEDSNITSFPLADSLTVTHFAAYMGSFWIAIFTPIYFVIKRHSPRHLKLMLKTHVFGNLLAFALITTHYMHIELNSVFLGTGIVLYITLLSIVATGIIQRINVMKSLRKQVNFIHVSMTTAFYLILIIHVIGTFLRI